jgi:hypothetical protein
VYNHIEMSFCRLIAVLLAVVSGALFLLASDQDALGDNPCSQFNNGCSSLSGPNPCSAVNDCTAIDDYIGTVPSNSCLQALPYCVVGSPESYQATTDTSWYNCHQWPIPGPHPCTDDCIVCATVTYYNGTTCSVAEECGTGYWNACGFSTGQVCS